MSLFDWVTLFNVIVLVSIWFGAVWVDKNWMQGSPKNPK